MVSPNSFLHGLRFAGRLVRAGCGLAALVLTAAVAVWAGPALGATYTWDISGSGSNTDGPGQCNIVSKNWDGILTVVWPNDSTDTASFTGVSGGTVTVGTSLAAGGITIGGSNGYLFNGSGSPTLTLDSGGITVASGVGAQTFDTTLARA